MPTFRHLPVTDLLDVTHNFEQLQAELALLGQPRPAGPTFVREQWKLLSALGYKNAWEDFEAGRKGEYRKNPFGNVEVRGVVKTGTTGTEVITLPAGYRPKQEETFVVRASGGVAAATISTAGVLALTNITGEVKTNCALSGLIFSVE